MSVLKNGSFRCKFEEVSMIGTCAVQLAERDKKDFTSFAADKYGDARFAEIKQKVIEVSHIPSRELVAGESKAATANLYGVMDRTLADLPTIERYIKLASGDIGVANTNFGISNLRKSIRKRDAEGTIAGLTLLKDAITTHSAALKSAGLADPAATAATYATAIDSINTYSAKQFELKNVSKEQTKARKEKMASLVDDITDILETGNCIFRSKNPDKAKEYTFSYLLKQVRTVSKPKPEPATTAANSEK